MNTPTPSSPFTLAVCAEMIFRDLPVLERIKRISELGFQVEIWDWTKHDIDALANSGATFSSMTGYVTGTLADAAGADELLRTAAESGLDGNGLPVQPCQQMTGAMWLKARDTLNRLADLGEQHGITFVLENLNTDVDHPGVPFARLEDVLALVESVDRPSLRIMLDVYHAQIGEGNLIELIRRCGPYIGEVQVADVPGRCEPGTGEINNPAIANALNDMGYRGTVGLEGWASGDDDLALDRFRAAFSL